jgi:hypothetical protein
MRSGTTSGIGPATRPADLLADPGLAERFAATLAAGGASSPSRPRDWAEYLEECAGRIGRPLLHFALGLPQPPQAGGEPDAGRGSAPSLRSPASSPETGDGADVPEQVRARYRRWAARMAELSRALPIAERLLAIQALLCVIAQGAWDDDDHGWYLLLAGTLRALSDGDLPVEAEPAAGSLAAVALSILRASTPRYWQTRETHDYLETSRAVAYLMLAADEDRVAEYVSWLGTAFGSAALPAVVLDVAAEVIEPEPLADAISGLAEIGREAHAHAPNLLHLTGKFGNPVLAALEGVGAIQDMEFAGVWATSTTGPWALIIWRSPDMVIVDARSAAPLWQHRRLTPLQRPKAMAGGKDLSSAPLVPHGPQNRPFPEASALLHLLGLSSPNPPQDCAP